MARVSLLTLEAPMVGLAHRLLTALAIVLAVATAATAQGVAETASRWGLLGTWRVDCVRPRSSNNGDLKYLVRNGALFHDRDFGDRQDSNPVVQATRKGDDTLEIMVNFTALAQTRQFAFRKGADGRIRVMWNRDVKTNQYSVLDGKFTASGGDAPWQTRCN